MDKSERDIMLAVRHPPAFKVKVRHEGRPIIGGVVQRDDGCALLVGVPKAGELRFLGPLEFGVGRQLVEALTGIPRLVRPTSLFAEHIGSRGVIWLERS